MAQRSLSDKDILEMDNLTMEKDWEDRRPLNLPERRKNRKDRRVAINTMIDPAMDRRVYNRRHKDRK